MHDEHTNILDSFTGEPPKTIAAGVFPYKTVTASYTPSKTPGGEGKNGWYSSGDSHSR